MLAALNHPNIATIYDVGEVEGHAFLVMELLEGKTLRECIGGEPLEIDKTIVLATQIAEALDQAHAKGIIQRDIKPANIFVTARGPVKVLDFGVASRTERPDAGRSLASTVEIFTNPGLVMGTIETCRRNKHGVSRWMPVRTSSVSAWCCMKWPPPSRHFGGATTALVFDALSNQDPASAGSVRRGSPGLSRCCCHLVKLSKRCSARINVAVDRQCRKSALKN